MKPLKLISALILFIAMASCASQEEEIEIVDQPETTLSAPSNLEAADSVLSSDEMGSEHEGPEKKDLEKKSADFDPAEVKLGKEGK